jgi:FkbM family methyltransferase
MSFFSLMRSLSRRVLETWRDEGALAVPKRGFALINRLRRQATFKPYVIEKSVAGMAFRFEVSDIWAEEWFATDFERGHGEMLWIIDNIQPGMTVIDCGAHHGFYTMLFANSVGPSGQVHAIEALPENAQILARNLALNNLTNVTVHNIAAGSCDGSIDFRTSIHGIRESNGRPVLNNHMEAHITVPMTTLDKLFESVQPDFIKIDVEGFELEVLRGARQLMASRPGLDLEIHSSAFENGEATIDEIFRIVQPEGFLGVQIERIVNSPMETFDTTEHIASALAKLENVHLLIPPQSWRAGAS